MTRSTRTSEMSSQQTLVLLEISETIYHHTMLRLVLDHTGEIVDFYLCQNQYDATSRHKSIRISKQGDLVRKAYQLGKLNGLRFSLEPSFFIGTLILWLIFATVAIWLLDLPFSEASVVGLIVTVVYWISEIVHQLGHAYAARQTGYPMVGVHLGTYLFFSTSVYPDDEATLPAHIHIWRALGGPMISLALTFLTGLIVWFLSPRKDILWWLALSAFFLNLGVFTIGAFLPLGFTDGSTLLRWWRKR